jgi:hypothetical protein
MVLLPAIALVLFAQRPSAGPSTEELAAMAKLDFLVGSWSGTGFSMTGPGQSVNYTGSETVQKKLQGKALLVEGKFTNPETKAVVHETLAVITYDVPNKNYRFQAHLFNQPSSEFELHVVEKGFWWEIVREGAPKIKFTMTITDKGEWLESGEVTIAGNDKPLKFMEMKLTKGG